MTSGPLEGDELAKVDVNGRFLEGRVTGVQRYAREVTKRLQDRIRIIRAPRGAQGLRGHLWEQGLLPGRVRKNALLWSPANTGPLRVRNQVLTIHDLSVLDHPEWFSRSYGALYSFLLPRLSARVDHVITVSEFSRSRIVSHLGLAADRVTVVPLGVDDRFRPPPPDQVREVVASHGITGDYLLSVGSLEPRKNLQTLFDAWQGIQGRWAQVELIIAGAGGAVFRSPGFERIPARVRLLDYVPDEDLPALYRGATAYIMPSVYEGFGLPILEAMSCGVPVISSDAASLPEVAGEAALYVDSHSSDSIAQGIERILENGSLRERMIRLGLEHAQGFSWEACAEDIWQTLERVSLQL